MERSNGRKSDEIISGNLTEIWERQKKLDRLRLSQAYEILSRIAPEIDSAGSAVEAVGAISLAMREAEWLNRFTTEDKLIICRRAGNRLREAGYEPEDLLFTVRQEQGASTIAYVENQYSTAAYEIFTSKMPDARARIYNSFTEMCEDTAAGEVDACILPIENTPDGKLLSFYSLIDRTDLKISAACDLYGEDESRQTRYALLRRLIPSPGSADELCFEFSFAPTPTLAIDQMLNAALILGLSVYRIDSVSLRYNQSNFILHPILQGDIESILVFALFLSLSAAQYSPVGLFELMA